MHEPLFSIVIPCHNSWRFMSRGLRSLEQQTLQDFEVLFVDDCSTDDTYSQLLAYQEKSQLNAVVLKNEKNIGPGKSRNLAISQAKGEYVAFMDSDDWYETDFLEQIRLAVQKEKADMIFCDFYRCYQSNKREEIKINSMLKGCGDKEYVALAFTSLWCLSVRTIVARKYPIPDIYHGEDAAIIPVWTAKTTKKIYVPKPLYNYVYRQNSLSSSVNQQVLEPVIEGFCFLKNKINGEYQYEIEFRGICMILYAGVFKAVEADISPRRIWNVIQSFEEDYPKWSTNPYLNTLPARKRVFLRLLKYKMWRLIKLYTIAQKALFTLR